MSLQQELGFPNPIRRPAHEATLNVIVTSEMLAKEGDRILRPLGLTISQFNVLMLLKHQSKNGAIGQTRLGQMLLVNRSNVTGLVDRMEKVGWVKREAEAGDRRVKVIGITKKGRQVLNRAEKVYYTRIEEIMRTMSSTEILDLCGALEQVRTGLRETRGG